jgi:hypothetical protein
VSNFHLRPDPSPCVPQKGCTPDSSSSLSGRPAGQQRWKLWWSNRKTAATNGMSTGRNVMSCHGCHVMSCHVMSCHVMSCHVMSCHVMSCHVMSCHVMSCHVMSCHGWNVTGRQRLPRRRLQLVLSAFRHTR